MIEIIREMDRNGNLKLLLKRGLISIKTVIYYEICLEVDKQQRTTRKPRLQIITEVAEQFKTSERAVYRALKLFSDENGHTDTNTGRGPAKVC